MCLVVCMHVCQYSLYASICTNIVCFADVDCTYAEVFRKVGDLLYLSSPLLYKKSSPDHIQGPILYTVLAPALRYGRTGKLYYSSLGMLRYTGVCIPPYYCNCTCAL